MSLKTKFIGEAIKPVAATFDTSRMAAGEPGLPREFVWRKETVRVAKVCREWRETGPCDHGSSERYVRKHWYEVETDTGRRLTLYFERKARGKQAAARWQLFSARNNDNAT